MRTSDTDQTIGIATRMASASPGPTSATSVSMEYAPPETLKNMTKTSGSVVSARRSVVRSAVIATSRQRHSRFTPSSRRQARVHFHPRRAPAALHRALDALHHALLDRAAARRPLVGDGDERVADGAHDLEPTLAQEARERT